MCGGLNMLNGEYGVPEVYLEEAKGNLNEIYHDIQMVLKVPIVNFIFRTLALYETFLGTAWSQVRPNMLTVEMEKATADLRYPDISVKVPRVNWESMYDLKTIEQIKRIVFTFNYVNPKLLLIVSAWAESLGNRQIHGKQGYSRLINPGVIPGLQDIQLVKVNHTTPGIRKLLLDIVKEHHGYDAASDYRALAIYPHFLAKSWHTLKPYVGSLEYNLLGADLKRKSIEFAHERMAFPVTINPDLLDQFYNPMEVSGIMGIVSMFQNLLPNLIIEGEFFRRMLHE